MSLIIGYSSLSFLLLVFVHPIANQKVELSLKCSITDNSDTEVYSKSTAIKKTAYSAMYWGYRGPGAANLWSQGDVHRAANLMALSSAMNLFIEDIKINKDKIVATLQ